MPAPDGDERTIDAHIRVDQLCDEFESLWQQQQSPPNLDDFINRGAADCRADLAFELVVLDRHYRESSGDSWTRQDYLNALPDWSAAVSRAFGQEGEKRATVLNSPSLEAATIDSVSAPNDVSGLIGERVRYFGDYELLSEIARGGMGVVYRAKQISLNRIIALKMILAGQIAGDDQVRRFQLEAEAAANLDHPGIVPIYDIGEHNGQHYFSMKLIEGQTLSQLADSLRSDPQRSIELVAQVADAMHHAHQRGILHRDLKPGNILVDADGNPLVTDFGLARNTESDQQLTQTGAVVGTPGFMSPEQASGATVTTAADIYSLGAILYQLICGQPPHAGGTVMETLMSVINKPAIKPRELNPDVHPDLELICLKCLSKDPAQRYASAAEFASDLRAHVAGEPLHVRAPSVIELARMWLGSNYGNVIWVPVIALVVGISSGFSLWAVTFGQDMNAAVSNYEYFAPSERPIVAANWARWRIPFMLLYFLMLGSVGWATAKLVRTKNRAADIGAGLSVGLLVGLLALSSGMGSVLLECLINQATRHDGELLTQLAVVHDRSYTHDRITTRYPSLEQVDDLTQRALILANKFGNDRIAISMTGMFVSSMVCLLWYGLLGTMQTWIAGPLAREHKTWRGFSSYCFFTLASVAVFYIVASELTVRVLYGSGYILDGTNPVVCVIVGVLGIFSVLRRWSLPAQSAITLVWVALFVAFIYGDFLKTPIPVVARTRTELKVTQQLVDSDPTRRDYALRLSRAHHSYALLMDQLDYGDMAVEHFKGAIESLGAGTPREEFDNEERILNSSLLFSGANIALKHGQPKVAADWLSEHTRLYFASSQCLDLYADTVLAIDEPAEDYVRLIGNLAKHPAIWTVSQQVRALAEEKQSDEWTRELIEKVLDRRESQDPSAGWLQHRERVERWLRSRQEWEFYGPFKLDLANENELTSIDTAYGPEAELVAGRPIEADGQFECFAGAHVDLHSKIANESNVVCYLKSSFTLDEQQTVDFRLGVDDAVKIWIDGEEVHRNNTFVGVFHSNDRFKMEDMKAGQHSIVMKITQGPGEWGFTLDAGDMNGGPLPLWNQSDE